MRFFPINPFGAAIIITMLCMGLIGLIVVLPIVCIQWTWNQIIPSVSILPPIGLWQAVLLYLACAIGLYLSGLVRVEIDIEKAD